MYTYHNFRVSSRNSPVGVRFRTTFQFTSLDNFELTFELRLKAGRIFRIHNSKRVRMEVQKSLGKRFASAKQNETVVVAIGYKLLRTSHSCTARC